MPDGDKVHAKLRHFYQNAYKQLCENPFNPEDVARELLRALKKSIHYDGGARRPFRMLEDAAAQLEQLPKEPLARELVDWVGEACSLEMLARMTLMKKRIAELALRTCKEQLHDLRFNALVDGDMTIGLHGKYLSNLYQSEFEERIPLAEHYNGVSQETIDARLEALRPHVLAGLAKFAEQIKRRGGDASSLRMPRREGAREPIGLDTDLLAGL